MTIITVTNGQGRPKNPYKKLPINAHSVYPIADILKNNELFDHFEQSVQYHEAPGIPDGDYEAILLEQHKRWNDTEWVSNAENSRVVHIGLENRAIWVIKSEKEERKDKQSTGAYQFGGFKDSPFKKTPHVSKEEGKTAEEKAESLYPKRHPADALIGKQSGRSYTRKMVELQEAYIAGAQWQADQQLSSQKDEIERLREVLRDISNLPTVYGARDMALNALNSKSK